MVYNVSLKGQILSRQCKSHPDNINGFKLFIHTIHMIIASGHFVENFSNFDSVQTVSILSGRFQYCPDGFNTVQTVSILSGGFHYCPDGLNTVRKVLLSTLLYARGDLRAFSYVATGDLRTFLYVARSVFTRFVRKVFARKKLLSGKF